MPLRVAFDLDGTIANMQRVLQSEAAQLFAAEIPSGSGKPASSDPPDSEATAAAEDDLALTRAQQSRLWEHVRTLENFWGGLPEMEEGIVARIAATAASRRWEVIFLTTRPVVAGDTVQIQSQRWLRAHGFEFPSVFVVQRSRGKIADALELDAVVDDRPENCLDVALDSKAAAILIWPGDPQNTPLGVDRLGVRIVPTVSAALDMLIRLDDERQPSVARTLRKLLRRETTA
jgi:hypothetical protein